MNNNLLSGWNMPTDEITLDKANIFNYLDNTTYYYQKVYNAAEQLMDMFNAFWKFGPIDKNYCYMSISKSGNMTHIVYLDEQEFLNSKKYTSKLGIIKDTEIFSTHTSTYYQIFVTILQYLA